MAETSSVLATEPVYQGADKGWTCPDGYAFPRCSGCGHNFFDSKPGKMKDGRAPDGGLCHWCVEEERNPQDRYGKDEDQF